MALLLLIAYAQPCDVLFRVVSYNSICPLSENLNISNCDQTPAYMHKMAQMRLSLHPISICLFSVSYTFLVYVPSKFYT